MLVGMSRFGRMGLPQAWSPLALWPLGAASPGLWIDGPSYPAACWKDSSGTTPLSTVGTVLDTSNPAGLILDRKGGLALGAELVTNGDFSNGTTGWSPVDANGAVVGGVFKLTNANYGMTIRAGVFPVVATTKKYRISVTISNRVAGGIHLTRSAMTSGGVYLNSAILQANGTHVFYADVPANTTTPDLRIDSWDQVTLDVDNISVRELPGIHLSQSTSAARPVASARKNLLVATATLSTQSVTVTAIPHTITFGGGGTIVATGAYVGALTSGQTFTPTAGTLTLTVAGSVTSAQLERGSTVTPYQRVNTASDYDTSGFPVYAKFDGTDDSLATATFAAGTLTSSMDCLIAVRRDSAAATYLISDTVSRGFFEWESGDTNRPDVGAGTPTYLVDGAAITATRGALFTALAAGSWHILEARGLDLSTWTALGVSSFVSYRLNGGLGGIQLFASGQDANRDKARARMAAYFGVTLA